MRMPESKLMVVVPVFLLSALEVAVMVTRTLGNIVWFGNFAGAVKVAVEATVVLVFTTLERVPTALGVGGVVELSVAAVHCAEAEGLGLGTAVVGVGVGGEGESKVEDTSVAPVPVAGDAFGWCAGAEEGVGADHDTPH